MNNKAIDQLLSEQDVQIKKLHQIVAETMKEQTLINDNLLHPPTEIITRGQSISDKVVQFGGSWKFIIMFWPFCSSGFCSMSLHLK